MGSPALSIKYLQPGLQDLQDLHFRDLNISRIFWTSMISWIPSISKTSRTSSLRMFYTRMSFPEPGNDRNPAVLEILESMECKKRCERCVYSSSVMQILGGMCVGVLLPDAGFTIPVGSKNTQYPYISTYTRRKGFGALEHIQASCTTM